MNRSCFLGFDPISMRVSKIRLATDISMNTFFVSCQTATWRNKVFIAIISYQAATNTCNFFKKIICLYI